VQLLVFTVVALCALPFFYAIGLGGSVSTIIFLTIMFVGVLIRVWQPLLDRLRP
jgi:O-antigen ligase